MLLSALTRVRRPAVIVICLASLALAGALLWRILPHAVESADAVRTIELLALLGLFVLPTMAVWTLLGLRRSARRLG